MIPLALIYPCGARLVRVFYGYVSFGREITNSKTQITNKFQIPMIKR